MQFESPYFFWGLFTLLIPIAIHFFNKFRAKKLAYSDVSVLQQVAYRTNKVNKLKELLTLLSRLLVLLFLVLAFTEPFIPSETEKQTDKEVIVFIDNTKSSGVQVDGLSNLDRAKSITNKIINVQNDDATRFLIFSVDNQSMNLLTMSNAKQRVSEILLSERSMGFHEQVEFLSYMGATKPEAEIYWVSDFQSSSYNETDSIDFAVKAVMLPTSELSNIVVDSIWVSTPLIALGETVELNVRYKNKSSVPANGIMSKVYVNGNEINSTNLDIQEGASVVSVYDILKMAEGHNTGEIQLSNDQVSFDNQFYFSLRASEGLDVLFIGSEGTGSIIGKVFENESMFSYKQYETVSLDYEALEQAQFVILEQTESLSSGLLNALKTHFGKGGTVLVLNESGVGLKDWSGGLKKQKVGMNQLSESFLTNDGRELLDGVFKSASRDFDMPSFKVNYTIKGGKPLLTLNRQPILIKEGLSEGNLYIGSFDLTETQTNLAKHALCVPLFYQLAFGSSNTSELYYEPGTSMEVLSTGTGYLSLENELGKTLLQIQTTSPPCYEIPEDLTSGQYDLKDKDSVLFQISINNESTESEMSFSSGDELEEVFRENGMIIKGDEITNGDNDFLLETDQTYTLWKYCLILALAMLLAETLILRFIK